MTYSITDNGINRQIYCATCEKKVNARLTDGKDCTAIKGYNKQ